VTGARVHVVTDSTASLPADLAARLGIIVVPLAVVVGDVHHLDGVDFAPAQLLAELHAGHRVATSQPSPEAFARAYAAAAESGAGAIVSVHLSSELSGTVQAARLAAQSAPVPVHVVDSRSVAMGLGLAAIAAVEEISRGADAATAAAAARKAGVGSSAWFLVDSLDHLRRGGRLSATAAALGAVLGMRPLLGMGDGRLDVAAKVRTRAGARTRLAEIAVADAAWRQHPRVAVHHLGDVASAQALVERLAHGLAGRLAAWPGDEEGRVLISEASAVLGAHVGPGLLAVVVGGG
jgi:DegV family protein with EDD domain